MIQFHPAEGGTRKVTFTLPEGLEAQAAGLVGDFLDESWNPCGHPMAQGPDGRWRVTLELEVGQRYEFRYWVNQSEWHNDDGCPQTPNPFGSFNSLLDVPEEPSLVMVRET